MFMYTGQVAAYKLSITEKELILNISKTIAAKETCVQPIIMNNTRLKKSYPSVTKFNSKLLNLPI